jgi:putative ABC transport system permease protein
VIRQLVVEAGVLALVAGAAGLAAAYAGLRLLLLAAPRDLPRMDEIHLDAVVLLFALALTMGTAFACGMWPAYRLSRVNLQEALREGGRGLGGSAASARTRSALLVVECALAIMLLAGAGLLLRSLAALHGMDTGFRTANVLLMRVNSSRTKFAQLPQLAQFYDQLLQRARSLPGATGAAIVSDLFLSNTPASGTFTLEDRPPFPPSEQIEATTDGVSPGFFETMQVRLVHGRFFDERDKDGAPRVIVINETFAKRYWPNEDPTGKRLVFGTPDPRNPWLTIVGVAGDMRRRGLHQGARLEAFVPIGQSPRRNVQLLLTTNGAPLSLAAAARAEVRTLDPATPVTAVTTVDSQLGESLALRRFQAWLLTLFSVLAVLLAAVGIFGLMAQTVARRTPEIGLRLALGATPSSVLSLVLRQGVALAAAGAILGIGGALAIARGLDSLLFGIGAADPTSYAIAAAVMTLSVVLACTLPAWRAARVDPMIALRTE